MISNVRQDPSALLDYRIDWSQYLEEEDTIVTSTWTSAPSGLTLSNQSSTATTATTWVTGGTVGTRYEITNRITTAGGRVDDRTFTLTVANL